MSATETPVEVGIRLDIDLGDEQWHLACCRADRFFCGRQYHEELVGPAGTPREEYCPTCVEINEAAWECPALPRHPHCPVPGPLLGLICPSRRD